MLNRHEEEPLDRGSRRAGLAVKHRDTNKTLSSHNLPSLAQRVPAFVVFGDNLV